jgi:L,D-peptidoglycan transpeptidase YkuD (ErfK/YbiS/YcfS/YnhG family)
MEICTTSEDRTWREKLVSKTSAKVDDARVAVGSLTAKANSQLRTNPAKWAGIAAGTGFAIGMAGRFLRHRSHERSTPAIVIIEATC